METTRSDHLAWCRARAVEYLDAGDNIGAFGSMASDLNKHPETANHPGIELGVTMLYAGYLDRPEDMRNFIEGFY